MSWLTRKRTPTQPVTGANLQIRMGQFGQGGVITQVVQGGGRAGIYSYHEGDLFGPGAGNYVFEPNFELPLQTIWGRAFVRFPNTFKVYQAAQVWSQPNVMANGIGGLEAGQLVGQPLLDPGNLFPSPSEISGG